MEFGKWLGLTVVDWVVVALYLATVTVLGVMAYRKVHDMGDYFMGGRRFGKVFMMFFAFGAGTSSEQANGVVAGTWRVGLAGIWWQFLWLWATPFYWLVAPVMRRMRALTTSDFFAARFDRSTSILYSLWGMIMAVVFIAGALYGSGKMVDALTGGELSKVATDTGLSDYAFVPVFGKSASKSPAEPAPPDPEALPDPDASPAPKAPAPAGRPLLTWRSLEGYEIAILAITVLFVIYGMAGGLGAAIWTDFIQGILTISFSFMLLPFVLAKIGGFAALNPAGQEPVKKGMFDLVASEQVARALGTEPITVFYVFMLSLTGLVGIVVQPHIMGVCGAGKTEFEGRFGFTFGNFIKRFCTIAWTFTALGCLVWYLGNNSPLLHSQDPADREAYTNLKTMVSDDVETLSQKERDDLAGYEKDFADRLFGRAAHDILPGIAPGLVGLLLASLLAAMMSTCDAQMIVASGLFTENIYKKLIHSGASERHYVWVGRLAGLIVVVLALILQTTFTDVINALKVIIKTPAFIGISLWIGVAWRGWTPLAVWVSSMISCATWGICAHRPDWIAGLHLDFMMREGAVSDAWTMVAFMVTGVVSGLLVSFVTPRTPREKLDHFFRLMRTPVRPGEEIAEPCTLPDNALEPVDKLIKHPDFEIPKPTVADLAGFAAAWVFVGLIIALTFWLASPS